VEFATTAGDLALSNLDSMIEGATRALGSRTDSAATTRLVALLLLRGQVLGRIADYERADALARALARATPRSAEAHRVMASVHTTLHRFAAAQTELERAQRLGTGGAELAGPRAVILEATGRSDETVGFREREAKARPDIATLTSLAVARGAQGDITTAGSLFVRAQDGYRDPSPFPLANLYLQEGLMAERAGDLGRAQELLAAAVERVPGFAPATSHLAGLLSVTGRRPRAIDLLESLVRTSDDPEHVGQLADLLRAQGRNDEAQRRFRQAEARFEEVLRRMPEAYASHAARFYLTWGQHRDRALSLARRNVAERPTAEALTLAVDAFLAAGDARSACATADRLASDRPRAIEAWATVARAFDRCGRQADARSVLARVEAGGTGKR